MNNSTLPYWLTFAVLLAALYGGFKWYQVERYHAAGAASYEEGGLDLPPLTDFELTERSGKTFRSADMKGKVWVVSFFFSSCTGTCSRLNAGIAELSRRPEAKDVTFVSITVDPVTDTLTKLREYADRHHADPDRWLFCRADDFDYIKRLADDVLHVGVMYQGHKDYAVIIDRNGKIADMFNAVSTSDSERGMKIIQKCLAEPAKSEAKLTQQTDSPASPAPAAAASQANEGAAVKPKEAA
jgi:cytochrome oxidase Cu insertion factor (SCO1/SenC/PrrC family)